MTKKRFHGSDPAPISGFAIGFHPGAGHTFNKSIVAAPDAKLPDIDGPPELYGVSKADDEPVEDWRKYMDEDDYHQAVMEANGYEPGEIDTAFEGYKDTNVGKNKKKKKQDKAELALAATDKGSTGTYKPYKKCYETHPEVSLGGGTIIGGACAAPIVNDADVYIGFDYSVKVQPYNPGKKHAIYVHYPITDMQAPTNPEKFAQLIADIKGWLAEGKRVHMGCIGGHGRTGTVIAALVKEITGNADATEWTRENYCHKAVESSEQVNFLHKHYGITKAKGHKEYAGQGNAWGPIDGGKSFTPSSTGYSGGKQKDLWPKSTGGKEISSKSKPKPFAGSTREFAPVASTKNVFKAKIY